MVVRRTDTEKQAREIRKAARIIRRGGLVAFPTETVYGLGVDATNAQAVARLFSVKRRPRFDPLIVHVASSGDAFRLWKTVPPLAKRLIKKFWPGPLTLILPKTDKIPPIVTAGLGTVAVRMPAQILARRLIREAGRPLAAPSANLFGRTSATSAGAVADDLGRKIDLVLDGGRTRIGVESTVLKIEGNRCLLLRPGGVSVEALKKAGVRVRAPKRRSRIESPGQSNSHYAPRTPLFLSPQPLEATVRRLGRFYKRFSLRKRPWPAIGLLAYSKVYARPFLKKSEALSRQRDLTQAASNLFYVLRKLDRMGLDLVIAESFPPSGLGLAIQDRLKRASAFRATLENTLKKTSRKKRP